MRYLVFSDVHGNVEALEQVLEHAAMHKPDIIVSLGDVVGYGANPNECVEMVNERAQIRIGGNHDLAVAGITGYEDFNRTAKRAINWTAKIIEPRNMELLSRYDATRRHEDCIFAHASPLDPLDFEYIYTMKQARRLFEARSERFMFVGHTHIPSCIEWQRTEGCSALDSSILQLSHGSRYLINVGSIGQPRDGIAAASYALLDTK